MVHKVKDEGEQRRQLSSIAAVPYIRPFDKLAVYYRYD